VKILKTADIILSYSWFFSLFKPCSKCGFIDFGQL